MHTRVSHLHINPHKDNTIRVPQWTKQMRQDRVLLDVLQLLEQLNKSPQTDVSKDLQYLLDLNAAY